MTPPLDLTALTDEYRASAHRLLMFDYDGTLTPIVEDPLAALPTPRLLHTLTTIAANPANELWVISGRDQQFLQQQLGHVPRLGLSAEHGCFYKLPGEPEWTNLADAMDMTWQRKVIGIFQDVANMTPGSVVEIKKVAVTWHYRKSDPVLAKTNAAVCKSLLQQKIEGVYDVDVMDGKMNLEVRPRSFNKGVMAKRLVAESGKKRDFVICAGDDSTDEDMFRALQSVDGKHVFTCSIGPPTKFTSAKYQVEEPASMIEALDLMIGANVASI